MGRVVFVTGGARSGKSRFAEERALALSLGADRTYVATAQAFDDEMRERIQRHQRERETGWITVEEPLDAARVVRAASTPVVLLDCLSLLVSNLMLRERPHDEILASVDDLLAAARERPGALVVVSNEVGSGVVPEYPLGRQYRDVLGWANQRIAASASEAYLIVAGLPVRLTPDSAAQEGDARTGPVYAVRMSPRAHSDLRVRLATLHDVDDITRIYNEGIEDRSATFETKARTPGDVRAWFDGRHPIVVVEHEGRVVAFASTSTYRARDCYAGIAEFSVYAARDARGTGAGHAAMQGLIDAARQAGFWKLVSRVFTDNTVSRRLLARVGFREVGTYERHAQLDGVWRDVVIVERLLDPHTSAP